MTKTILTLATALAALSTAACEPYYNDPYGGPSAPPPGPPPPSHVNVAPYVVAADAGVFYDAMIREDIWYFDASVDDADGPLDVTDVWAYVYDDYLGGGPIASFELLPTRDATGWYAEYAAFDIGLDPFYPYYTVEIVAIDSYGAEDAVSLAPYTY